MQIYAMFAILTALALGGWKIYQSGFETAELRNQASAATALRAAYTQEAERHAAEIQARQDAENRAKALEQAGIEQAREITANRKDRQECPDTCYVVDW